jgi:hypothetical protein
MRVASNEQIGKHIREGVEKKDKGPREQVTAR